MDGEVAGADESEILFRVLGPQPAGAELEAVVLLVFEDAGEEQIDLFAVWVDLEFVPGGEPLDGAAEVLRG